MLSRAADDLRLYARSVQVLGKLYHGGKVAANFPVPSIGIQVASKGFSRLWNRELAAILAWFKPYKRYRLSFDPIFRQAV
jgi:hypothetical protein